LRLQGEVEGKVGGNGVQEQVRGMKVRSSVKKLCEGCKVCFQLLGGRQGIEWGGWRRLWRGERLMIDRVLGGREGRVGRGMFILFAR